MEQTFEAIADTRVKLLQTWTREQWEHLAELATAITHDTIKQVSHSSEQMRLTVGVLQTSAETVRVNANKLQKLVGLFEVSGEVA
ncbi:hypothetical protein HZF02_15065 [Pseudomonas yamanorum]|nr:hypothetical protein HZF02_15065 [Pseudomonas yamanorum]